jgi:hypothetical protein
MRSFASLLKGKAIKDHETGDTSEQLGEMGDKFEEIEHEQFGEDGYEDAVKQISDIEGGLGLSDITQFTAPPPPKATGA